MTDAYIVEVDGRTAGIVVRDRSDQAFGFVAAANAFISLEGRHFAAPGEAERAARGLVRQPSASRGRPAASHFSPSTKNQPGRSRHGDR